VSSADRTITGPVVTWMIQNKVSFMATSNPYALGGLIGSIFFATGLLGEQIAGQRAELREIRRQLDAVRATQDNAASGDEEV